MAEVGQTELRSCVKVEVAVLVSRALISLMVSVDVMPVPNSLYGLRGRKKH